MYAGALRVLFARVLSIKCDKISFRECAAREVIRSFLRGFCSPRFFCRFCRRVLRLRAC